MLLNEISFFLTVYGNAPFPVKVPVSPPCIAYYSIKYLVYTTVQLPLSYSSPYRGYLSSVPRPVPSIPLFQPPCLVGDTQYFSTTWYITGCETCTCIIFYYVGDKDIRLDEGYLSTLVLIFNSTFARQHSTT